jgi:hypothetical protein
VYSPITIECGQIYYDRRNLVETVHRGGIDISLSVKDSGIGMDETTKSKLFLPFCQGLLFITLIVLHSTQTDMVRVQTAQLKSNNHNRNLAVANISTCIIMFSNWLEKRMAKINWYRAFMENYLRPKATIVGGATTDIANYSKRLPKSIRRSS